MSAKVQNDGSGNPMIFAHLHGQIFGNVKTCPYCSNGEEATLPVLTDLGPLLYYHVMYLH